MARPALRCAQGSLPAYLARISAHRRLQEERCIHLETDARILARELRTVENGMRLMTESGELRKKFPFFSFKKDAYGEKYEQEAGLKHETRDGENKYVFQYIREAYANGRRGSFDVPDLRPFFAVLQNLDQRALDISLALAEHLDHIGGDSRPYTGSMLRRIARGTRVTRVLRYLPVENESSDAYPHIDRSIFSVHWGATHQGLWLYMPDGSRIRTDETDAGNVCLFTGRKYAAATRDSAAGCPHGVKYERTDGEDRYSFITFVHPEPLDEDVAWLLENDASLKTYERSLTL
jgi:hypothetical protein